MSPLARSSAIGPITSAASSPENEIPNREFQLAPSRRDSGSSSVPRPAAIPPARYAAASGKSEFCEGPISNQKGVYVTAVPPGLLPLSTVVIALGVGVPSLSGVPRRRTLPNTTSTTVNPLANRTDRKLTRMNLAPSQELELGRIVEERRLYKARRESCDLYVISFLMGYASVLASLVLPGYRCLFSGWHQSL